jgi:hypothetical protein
MLFLTALRNIDSPLSEMKYLSLFIRFAIFTNSSTTFDSFLYFLLPFFLLSFTNWTTSCRSFSRIPGSVRTPGKPAYEPDLVSHQPDTFSLGAFAKLRKATISFVTSVCPSVRPSAWNYPAPAGRIFMKCYISVFENLS